jgi:hypothetical protein
MNLLLLLSMVRFNDTFLFAAGLAFFIGGFFTGSIVSFFLFGGCFGLLIRHAIQDLKNKK